MVLHALLLDIDCITGNTSDSVSVKVLNTTPSYDTMEHSSTDTMFIASVILILGSHGFIGYMCVSFCEGECHSIAMVLYGR